MNPDHPDFEIENDDVQSPTAGMPDNANLKFLPPYYFLITFVLSLIFETLYAFNFFSWQTQITLGSGLLGLGFILFAISLKYMLDHKTSPSPDSPTTTIVKTGPYRLSRNPIYVSFILVYFGLAVLFDIMWMFLFFPPMFYVFYHNVIMPEEAYLTRKFGAEYSEYKANVRRWI